MTNWFTLRDVKEIRDQYYCKGHDDGYKLGWEDLSRKNDSIKQYLNIQIEDLKGDYRYLSEELEKQKRHTADVERKLACRMAENDTLLTEIGIKEKWLVTFITISIIELGVILVLAI